MNLNLKSLKMLNHLLWLLLLCCCHLTTTQELKSFETLPMEQFNFVTANNSSEQTPSSDATDLTRQLITGTLTPNIVNTGSFCLCVPPGSCPNPLPTPPTDGSGQVDIRIVNNPFAVTTAPPFTCNYGLSTCCQSGSYRCGHRYPPPPQSKSAGPGQAEFGEYPWQAALFTIQENYFGSGALISAQHVLTVAHKVYNVPSASIKVRLGEWDAARVDEPIPSQEIFVSNIYIHPNFNANNLQNNVAILKLSTPVSLTSKSTIGTVCLPIVDVVGLRCYVSGWGKNDFGPTGAYQAIQRKVEVPLITNANCQTALRNTRLGASFVLNNSSFICAGGEAGKDACTGDGGSPLVCENNGVWYVVGMVAWGIGCASAGVPGVYVNVATFLPWIQAILAS